MLQNLQDARAHGDLTIAPTPSGIFVWRFEQRRGDPGTLKLVHVLDDLEAALSFARAAMTKTKGRVWIQERDGVVPVRDSHAPGQFPAPRQAALS